MKEGDFPIDFEHLDDLFNGLHKIWKAASGIHKKRKRGGADPYSVMLRLADDDALHDIYKILAKKVHPDHGGNTRKMAVLNACYQEIRRLRDIEQDAEDNREYREGRKQQSR